MAKIFSDLLNNPKKSKEGLGSASNKASFSENQSSAEKGLGDHVPAFFKVQI